MNTYWENLSKEIANVHFFPQVVSLSNFKEHIQQVDTEWIVFFYEDEQLYNQSFLNSFDNSDASNSLAYRVEVKEANHIDLFKRSEIRLFKKSALIDTSLLDFGILSVDGCSYIDIPQAGFSVSQPKVSFDQKKIAELKDSLPTDDAIALIRAQYLLEFGYSAEAENAFKQISLSDISSLRAAALNGLTECMIKKGKWEFIDALVDASEELCPDQLSVYLLKFKQLQYLNEIENAYEAVKPLATKLANKNSMIVDRYLSEEEVTFLIAESAYKACMREEAYTSYLQYFRIKADNKSTVESYILERLIIFALELEHFDEAKIFFTEWKERLIKNGFSQQAWKKIDEFLALFTAKQLFSYSINVYYELLDTGIHKNDTIRRLIALLIKDNQVQKARALAQSHKTLFT